MNDQPASHPRPVVDREALTSDPHGMREYADWLIKRHATDVESLSVHEMAEEFYGDGTELTDDEARSVYDLVRSAKVTVTWADAVLALLPTEEGEGS